MQTTFLNNTFTDTELEFSSKKGKGRLILRIISSSGLPESLHSSILSLKNAGKIKDIDDYIYLKQKRHDSVMLELVKKYKNEAENLIKK